MWGKIRRKKENQIDGFFQISDISYPLICTSVSMKGQEILVFLEGLLGFISCNHRLDMCLFNV